jgi:hypothetical protein
MHGPLALVAGARASLSSHLRCRSEGGRMGGKAPQKLAPQRLAEQRWLLMA